MTTRLQNEQEMDSHTIAARSFVNSPSLIVGYFETDAAIQ